LPTDPKTLARVDSLKEQLANARALVAAGKFAEAAPLARALSESAAEVRYPPLEAEALLVDGVLRGRTDDLAGAEATFYRAARVADAAGEDRLRVHAYAKLIDWIGARAEKRDLIPAFQQAALGVLERIGGDEDSEVDLAAAMGQAFLGDETKHREALTSYQRAAALEEKLYGASSNQLARQIGNVGLAYELLGELDDARRSYERTLAIEQKVLGPAHPDLAITWCYLGMLHLGQLEFKEAAADYEQGGRIAEAALGPESSRLAACLDGEAASQLHLGAPSRALSLSERALAIYEKARGTAHSTLVEPLRIIGEALLQTGAPARAVLVLERALSLPSNGYACDRAAVQFALARALVASGGERKRARELAVEARATYEKSAVSPLERRELAEMVQWLAAHP
jgi:tetratricopeptide (TPR) repeat protein